ncbi:helix-turn-helix domain-containing protein [Streptomyces roseolus]|uniref:helix-turn-helix domain-containing protein n=1 Tax=Streptomyces roseolus TaxID=67358 RepID=UPI0033D625F4
MAGAVLNAVVELVAERGMAELTMTAVAARAQVGKPATYRRWPTKQDLVIAAAETRAGASPCRPRGASAVDRRCP